MSLLIITVVFAMLVTVLLRSTHERGLRMSAAVWIAFAWLWFSSSRNPTAWLQPHGGGKGSAESAYDEGSAFDRNILTGIMLMGVVTLARRSKRTTAFLAANAPVILFFLFCALSATWSDHWDISIKRWFRGAGDVVMVLVILTELDWAAAVKWVYVRLACILIPLSMVFFRYFPALGRSYNIHDGKVSVTGVTDDKNLLGAICTLFSLAVISSMIDEFRRKGRRRRGLLLGYGLVVAMAAYLLKLADSATASACFVQGSIVLILASMPRVWRRTKRIHLLAGTMLGFSVINLFFGSSLLQLLGRNSTLTGRTDLWKLCLTLVTNPVIGAGYESFWLGQRLARMWEYIPGVNQAHNGYLEIYLNLGWMGVLLLATILIAGYRNITQAVHRGEAGASLRLAFFVVACIANCTEAGFKMMHPMWIAVLVACMARPALLAARHRVSGRTQSVGRMVERADLSKALPAGGLEAQGARVR
jgi:exopolysaccharide production protein ExoQ